MMFVLVLTVISVTSVHSFKLNTNKTPISSSSISKHIQLFDPLNLQNSNTIKQYNLNAVTNTKSSLDVKEDKNDKPVTSLPPWLPSFSTAALGGLLFGSDIGCSSSVTRIFGSGLADLGAVNAFQLGAIASTSLLGAMISSAILILVGDKNIGRKLELQTASLLFILGTTLQSFAPSLDLLYIGRSIFGLGKYPCIHLL